MKKQYYSPEAEVELFTVVDYVTTSGEGGLENGGEEVTLPVF